MDNFGVQFLSSLSPKINRNKKTKCKGPTVLSLKKHFRRSLSCDQLESTVPSSSLSIIEISSSDSGCSKIDRQLKSTSKIINESSSEITNSDKSPTHIFASDNEEIIPPSPNDKQIYKCVSTSIKKNLEKRQPIEMSKTKLFEIMNWVENVDKWNEEALEKDAILTNESIGESLLTYDEFESKTKKVGNQLLNSTIMPNVEENNCSDEEINEIYTEMSYRQKTSSEELGDFNKSCEDLLDDLYGASWRLKKDDVLTKSEKKTRRKKLTEMRKMPEIERKPKISGSNKIFEFDTKKTNSNNLLTTLQTRRFKMAIDAPCTLKLTALCDDDHYKENGSVKSFTKSRVNSGEETKNIKASETKSKKSLDKLTKSLGLINLQKCSYDKNNSFLSDEQNESCGKIVSLEYRIRKKWCNGPDYGLVDEGIHANKIKTVTKKIEQVIKTAISNNEKTKTSEIPHESFNGTPDSKYSSCSIKSKKNCLEIDKVKVTSNNLSESSEDCSNVNPEKIAQNSVQDKKTPIESRGNGYSFLASLSKNVPDSQCNVSAKIFRNNYKKHKENLAKDLFNLYNKNVFDNALPATTVLEWNSRMCSTAGYCCSKKITHRSGDLERVTKIVLSSKVLDSADRLRDTLIHEMCHAATWVVNHISNGHGEYWTAWTNKARKVFPELPPIKRCHNYEINTKYIYKCTGCSYSIGRHRKSLDIERKRCGYCLGKFEVLINKINKKGEQKTVPVTPKREPTGFALFVKENYSVFKKPGVTHASIMQLLSKKFNEMKV